MDSHQEDVGDTHLLQVSCGVISVGLRVTADPTADMPVSIERCDERQVCPQSRQAYVYIVTSSGRSSSQVHNICRIHVGKDDRVAIGSLS
jgi:hypothetical protein